MMDRPIFVVGTMRSGSTVFRLILDAHPRISISEETGFMGAVAATKQIPNWHHGRGWFQRIGWAEEELDARLREFWSGLFVTSFHPVKGSGPGGVLCSPRLRRGVALLTEQA